MEEIYISWLEQQRCSLEFIISFSKIVISNVGFSEKLKSFLETFNPKNQILSFEELLFICSIWIFKFYTDQKEIYSARSISCPPGQVRNSWTFFPLTSAR
jgi:hypothetical protein